MDQDLHQDRDARRSFHLHHGGAQMRHRVQSMDRFEIPAETVFDELLQRLDQASASGRAPARGDMASREGTGAGLGAEPEEEFFEFAIRR